MVTSISWRLFGLFVTFSGIENYFKFGVNTFDLSFLLLDFLEPLRGHKLGIKALELVFRCSRLSLFLGHEQLKIFFSVLKLIFLGLFCCLLFFKNKVIDALLNTLKTDQFIHCRSFDRFNEVLVVFEDNLGLAIG
jgi:hypothetical protein